HRLAQKYAPNPPVLPNDVSAQAHGLTSLPSAYPIKESAAEPWFQERLYQNFRYKRGKIEGAGPTGHKYSLIAEEFERIVSGSSYLDIGSNMGFFVAKAALLTDKPCIGIEKKGTFRLQAEHVFKVVGTKNARVIRARFNPNFPLTDSDVVSAFAVIHHLYLMDGAFISLASMVDYLAMAARKALFIEFIHNPGYKEKAEIMHGRSFNDYTETRLVNALKQRFSSVRKLAEVSPSRVVYLGTN
ncbi:MAG: hypothetical protein MI799_17510, partial [Desulfobacterales bacterium]|nr:hypothetical protein [Desulfobacterales bacterium]